MAGERKVLYGEREFTVIIEQDEHGYYVAEVVELPGCFTQAKSMEKLFSRVREAIEAYLLAKGNTRGNRFVGIQKIKLPAR